jgi:hypothetical protein
MSNLFARVLLAWTADMIDVLRVDRQDGQPVTPPLERSRSLALAALDDRYSRNRMDEVTTQGT